MYVSFLRYQAVCKLNTLLDYQDVLIYAFYLFCTTGLRTLCFAFREIAKQEYEVSSCGNFHQHH